MTRNAVTTGAVLLIYVVSQLVYKYLLGLSFNATPVLWFFQYLDIELLRNDLLRSLWNLHSQPPLMNLLLGLVLKISPEHDTAVLEWGYFLIGMAGVWFTDQTMAVLSVRPWIRILLCAILCFFPTLALYAHWAYTTQLEFLFCAMAAYGMARLYNEDAYTFRHALWIFIPCCILGMLRAHWHLIIFIVLCAGLLLSRRPGRQAFVKGAALALSPLLLLYLKNFLMFGFFGASSWAGINVAQVAVQIVPSIQIGELQITGAIAPTFPHTITMRRGRYVNGDLGQEEQWIDIGHPSLGRFKENGLWNGNNLGLLYSSKSDLADSLAIIRRSPERYASVVMKKFLRKLETPSFAFRCCGFDLRNINAFQDGTLSFSPAAWEWLRFGSLLLYGVAPLIVVLSVFLFKGYASQRRAFIVISAGLATFMLFSACALNGGEQERMRWGTQPFYVIVLAIGLEAAARGVSLPTGRLRLRTTYLPAFPRRRRR